MITSIKDTPVIYGNDAITVMHDLSLENVIPVSKEERDRIACDYALFKEMCKRGNVK